MFDNNLFPGSNFTTKIIQLRQANFNFDLTKYPIFDENYRETLNNKILDHYNLYEIGFETPALFRLQLQTKLNEIMPYYNQLYKSELLKILPLVNSDYEETLNRKTNGDSSSTSKSNSNAHNNSNGNAKHIFQETPQGQLVGAGIDEQTYATTIDFNKSDSNSNSDSNVNSDTSSKINNIEDYTRRITGTTGTSQSNLLLEFRKTFLNIDLQIIEELKDLFMRSLDIGGKNYVIKSKNN